MSGEGCRQNKLFSCALLLCKFDEYWPFYTWVEKVAKLYEKCLDEARVLSGDLYPVAVAFQLAVLCWFVLVCFSFAL
jgi:hypothetical protein